EGEAVVRQAIVDAFTKRSHWDPPSSQTLQITITKFRLRSTTNAFINGYFAGIDMLEGEAELTLGSAAPGRYTFKASGAEEGLFTYSSSARLRSLAGVLAAELANYIAPRGRSAAAGKVDPSAGGMQRMATGY